MVDASSQFIVQSLLDRCDSLILSKHPRFHTTTLAPYIYVIEPVPSSGTAKTSHDVALTLSVLIHGTEVGGLKVLVEILEKIYSGDIELNIALGLCIGNPKAALQGVRFVDRDLNRSFGRESTATWEDCRADEIERLFLRSKYLVDFHQVKMKIDRPFWIFPYSQTGYKFARAIAPEVTLVTHWGPGFSKDGQCSDEWLNRNGGTGITVELGQNGFDPLQIEKGVSIATRSIELVESYLCGSAHQPAIGELGDLYTWGEIIPYPDTGGPVLDSGWYNFRVVKEGERLGEFNGQVIRASFTGPILFPKYPDPRPDGTYAPERPAAELIRILKPITPKDLPGNV